MSGDEGSRAAGFAGLVHCGSPWACPCCARRIGAQRAQEIREVVSAVDADGGGCGLVTLTLRHHRGHRLTDSWSALRHAWARVTSGRAYQREVEQFGITGWIAAVEVTHSDRNGHHPHLHVVLCFDTPVSDDLLGELGSRWFARYQRALARRGFDALEFDGGLDTRTVTADSSGALAVYLAKLSLEVTGSTRKTGRRHSSRTMWEVLADGVATGLADDLEAWFEYERASHGRKQVTFSRGLRQRYRLAEEETDEDIAAADLGSDDLIALPAETWRAVRDVAEELLTVAEAEGLEGAVRWLSARRLAWSWARPAPPT
ncbi:protein rep [Pseudonocardia broussonetiae]|uniref:Protein rep n=1 Tax=Pseudonocardia broussonetiae TaxID=2736640 RepID=A0A6M6JG44_9PSEU|nr:protein rep [Pseudonocardia broussonetiae]